MSKVIYLPDFYQNIAGVQIQPGSYDIDDADLRGLGPYLLETGHATEVKTPKAMKEAAALKPPAKTAKGGKSNKKAAQDADEDELSDDETDDDESPADKEPAKE